MRRLLSFGLAWLAAAVMAVVVAWQGVGLVGDQVTDHRATTLTDDQVEAALADVAGESPSTTRSPATTGGSVPDGSTSTAAGDAEAETRTYRLGGGTVALRFTPERVEVAWAAPNPGFGMREQPADGDGWRVEFVGDDGRSRIEAWWDGGPRVDIDDDVDGGHDHEADDDERDGSDRSDDGEHDESRGPDEGESRDGDSFAHA